MGDTIRPAPDIPPWKQPYEDAILELDAAKLLQRIAVAQSAVVEQIDFSKSSDRQQLALSQALHMLSTLRTIAEREIGEQNHSRSKV
jgi:hypothetical protein